MVKMEICSDLEDQQISKLNEHSLIAYRIRKARCGARLWLGKFKCKKPNPSGDIGAKALRLGSKEASAATNGSFEPSMQDHRGTLWEPSSSSPESSLRIQETNVGLAPTDPTTPSESGNIQAPAKGAKALSARSDEEPREGPPLRAPPPTKHREASSRSVKEAAGASGSSTLSQVPPKNSRPPHSLASSLQGSTGQGGSSEISSPIIERPATRKELPAIGEKNSRESSDPGRGLNTSKDTPPSLALITHLGKGPGKNAPKGADLQGPSPVDHDLELEAEIP